MLLLIVFVSDGEKIFVLVLSATRARNGVLISSDGNVDMILRKLPFLVDGNFKQIIKNCQRKNIFL